VRGSRSLLCLLCIAPNGSASIGQVFKSLLGCSGNPALSETLAYVGYRALVGWFILGRGRPKTAAQLS
jgi:hypothetical protein